MLFHEKQSGCLLKIPGRRRPHVVASTRLYGDTRKCVQGLIEVLPSTFRAFDSTKFKVQIKITMKIRLQSLHPKLENKVASVAKLGGRTLYLLIGRLKPILLAHTSMCNLTFFDVLASEKTLSQVVHVSSFKSESLRGAAREIRVVKLRDG